MSNERATGIVTAHAAMGNPATDRIALEREERTARAIRDCIERTLPAAYSLALRISGDAAQAAAACERSYGEWAAGVPEFSGWSRAQEAKFLGRVRFHALAARRALHGSDAGDPALALRSRERDATGLRGSSDADSLGRRAVDLAYFGGMNAAAIAELLGEPVDAVRAAMRANLLELARSQAATAEQHDERI